MDGLRRRPGVRGWRPAYVDAECDGRHAGRRRNGPRVFLRPHSPADVRVNHGIGTGVVSRRRAEGAGLEPGAAGQQRTRLGCDCRARLPPADPRRPRRPCSRVSVDPVRLQRDHRAGELLVPAAASPAGAPGPDRAADFRRVHRAARRVRDCRRRIRHSRPDCELHDAGSSQEPGRRRGAACRCTPRA